MASQDHGIHSCKECVPEGSNYFQQTWDEEEARLIRREEERWKQLNIKLSPFKEDPSSDEEYEEINS